MKIMSSTQLVYTYASEQVLAMFSMKLHIWWNVTFVLERVVSWVFATQRNARYNVADLFQIRIFYNGLKGNDPCRPKNIEYVLLPKFHSKIDKHCGMSFPP